MPRFQLCKTAPGNSCGRKNPAPALTLIHTRNARNFRNVPARTSKTILEVLLLTRLGLGSKPGSASRPHRMGEAVGPGAWGLENWPSKGGTAVAYILSFGSDSSISMLLRLIITRLAGDLQRPSFMNSPCSRGPLWNLGLVLGNYFY